MPPAAPKTTRVSDAYDRLKAEILLGRMPPGFQAPEPEIALRLGMSRTPVREALIRLEAEGLVQLIPRRGARVLPVRAEDMREIYAILTALEPEAAAVLAESGTKAEDLAALEAAVAEMEAALAAQDLDRWAASDDAFHRALLAAQDNRRLEGIALSLYDQAHRARVITLRMRGEGLAQSTADHREILTHIQRGDGPGARRVFRSHRKRAARELLHILETYKLGQL